MWTKLQPKTLHWQKKSTIFSLTGQRVLTEKRGGHVRNEYKGQNSSPVLNLIRNVDEVLDQSVTQCGPTFRLKGLKSTLSEPVEAVTA